MDISIKQRLPSPKGVALAIMDACRREDVTVAEVAKLIQMDPALSGRLLDRANSASAGGARPAVSVSDAVNRLGLLAVRQLALSFSLIDQFKTGSCKEFDYPGFWSQSLLMAVAMKEFGSKLHFGSADELFCCGLLSRVGCLALATAYPAEYGAVLADQHTGEALRSLERTTLGTDHLSMSGELLSDWGLPSLFCDAVLSHEERNPGGLEKGSRPWRLAQTLYLSLQIAELLLRPQSEQAFHISEINLIASQLGIDQANLESLVDSVSQEWCAMGSTLDVAVAVLPAFSELARTKVRPDQESDTHWLRILVVEDDHIIRKLLETWMKVERNYTVMTSCNGKEALALAVDFKPHVIVTDWIMPVTDGIELCKTLRHSAWGKNIYVLMLTGASSEDDLVTAFEAGVDDFVTKPVNTRALDARLMAAWRYVRLRDAWERDNERLTGAATELALVNRKLELAALCDPLTDLANRRAGLTALTQAWSFSVRHQSPLSVVCVDVDHFKKINDTYGHAAGDIVLQALAQTLRKAARTEDLVCRWGGEEFLLICPNVALREGAQMAERLRRSIAALTVTVEDKQLQLTASLGLASWHAKLETQEKLLAEADKALYAAKAGGRNCVAAVFDGQVRLIKST
jgi:diguanylate cyclase (GGDEF)-like protein